MLAKKYRLPIQFVVGKSGQSLRGRYFLLKLFPSKLAFNRFGIIISKKAIKASAGRNKIKRIFFNTLKEFLFMGKEKKDILIIVSPKIISLDKKEITQEIIKELNYLIANH